MEYDPIFKPGFHDIKLDEMEIHFVNIFESKDRRKYLLERFLIFLERFKEVGINVEIWVDGSFSTHKEEPGDIDIIFFYEPQEVNSLSQDKRLILRELFGQRQETKIRFGCDVFFVPNNDHIKRSYWRGWFGFSRDETPKGIVRLELN